MAKKEISGGTAHQLPDDLRKALTADAKSLSLWESLTPLARNEWICWTILVKKEETRKDHVKRVVSELKDGMRRPCCWIGCIHRKDKRSLANFVGKPLSPSIKYVLSKRRKV